MSGTYFNGKFVIASRGAAAGSPYRSPDERAELAAQLAAEVADYGRQLGLI